MKSSSQLKRLLNLVPYLQHHGFTDISKVAADFGITGVQVVRDLEILQFCGLPDGYYDDLFHVDLEGAREDGFVSLSNAEVLRRPRRLRREEASSLLVALQMVVDVSGGSPAAASALKKLQAILGVDDEAMSVDVVGGDPSHRALLQDAIDSHEVLQVEHAGRAGLRRHEVEPVRLHTVDGFVYLEAWSRTSGDWRSFRLDRLAGVRGTGTSFEPRAGARTGAPDWFFDASELTLQLEPAGAWVAEYYPTRAVEQHDDHILVTFPMASRTWARQLLLRLGGLVKAVRDPGLLEETKASAAAALEHYA